MQQTFVDASSSPHKTTTSQLKHALVVENMSYTDSMFLDIYLHSPVHPLNCDGLWIKSSEPNSKCGHLSSRGHPLWVISCEEMFPAAHEFIMHYTPPPGAAKIPALVDILKPVCAIYPVDLPAACQGTSSNTEDGQEALTMVHSPCYNLTRGYGFLLGTVVSPCHMHYENYKCRRPDVLVREGLFSELYRDY